MCSAVVRLHGLHCIEQFVRDVENIDGNVAFKVGKFEISAKSIMNVFTLDLGRGINVVYRGKDEDKFYKTMSKYV